MAKVKRGEIWSADLEPQTHKAEPGKVRRPVLVLQTNALNDNGHRTTVVIPGTSQADTLAPDDHFPLRVRVQNTGNLTYNTDLLIDQVRAIAHVRLIERLCVITPAHMQKVKEALDMLTR